jgi:hypothetical protein
MASFPADLIPSITVASHDASKLPAALVSCGIFLIVSALALVVSKSPGVVLVTWHGSAAAYTYYAVLAGTVALGLAEASFGFWVVPRDLQRWNLTAKILLSFSILPLAVVLALWAGLKL